MDSVLGVGVGVVVATVLCVWRLMLIAQRGQRLIAVVSTCNYGQHGGCVCVARTGPSLDLDRSQTFLRGCVVVAAVVVLTSGMTPSSSWA